MVYRVLLCVLIFLKSWEIRAFELNNQICRLVDNHIGKCVPTSICPEDPEETEDIDLSNATCGTGKICCRISAKIVTPDNSNSIPGVPIAASPALSQAVSTTGSPQWVSVPPVVVNPTTASGSIPSSGSFPTGGSSPPSGSAPPGGSSPPNGSSPPSGSPPAGAPPGGSTPPSGPPPLVGNIVAEPGLPSKSLPPPPIDNSDTVVISAELVDNTIDLIDRKCELYHSVIQTKITTNQGNTPTVMIYGGVDSEEKEFPHMAALGFGEPNAKQWLCGGSLITENFVVTAAHCLSAPPLGEVRYVKLGSLLLDQDTENTQLLNVIRRIPHEQYDPQTQYNDIALLQLDQMVRITNYVRPICLFSSTNYEDRNLIATGWGKTDSGTSSMSLHKVGLELFTQIECQNAYRLVSKQQLPLGVQEAIQVCAGSHTQNKDTCQGDSGGPLQIRKNNRWYLIGITSIGIKCGVVNSPGIYTRVANYVQWIQQYVWNK